MNILIICKPTLSVGSYCAVQLFTNMVASLKWSMWTHTYCDVSTHKYFMHNLLDIR